MKKMRLFIAAHADDVIIKKYSDLVEELKTFGKGVKWVERENMHITLKFLGDTPEDRVEAVIKALSGAAAATKQGKIRFGSIGVFPNFKNPRVIKAGLVSGEELVADAAGFIDANLNKIGFEKEKRKFNAHLTLGRIKKYGPPEKLMPRLKELKDFNAGEMAFREFALIKSDLTKSGPIYTVLKKFALKQQEE